MCAAVLTAVLSVGCSQSDGSDTPDSPDFEEGIPTEVTITLSALSSNAQTRADKDPDGTQMDPTSSIELIHNWWIVFINKKGEVKVITDADEDVYDKIKSSPIPVKDPKGGYEAESFKIILPSGHYYIYAFANIPPQKASDIKKKLDKNKKLSNFYLEEFIGDKAGLFKDNTNPSNDGMQWPATFKDAEKNDVDNNIPMTKVMDKDIKNTIEEAFNVEVVRAVAKVEFAFSKTSTDVITLNKLEFGPITSDQNISFVPNDDAVGYGPNDKLANDVKKTGTLTFPNLSSLVQKPADAPSSDLGSFHFYCKESLGGYYDNMGVVTTDSVNAPHQSVFKINLTINRNGAEVDETRTLYTSRITYINRNDWIYIPIKFSNWVIKWKLHFYPPIGGYPPVFKQSDDGSSLSATLTTGGEFELYPVEVMQNSTKYDVDMNSDKMAVEVKNGENLFVTAPQVIDNPHKDVTGHPLSAFPKIITGELDPKEIGTADIEITFYLTAASGITEALKCTFHIIRQNSSPSN